ncbi:MAG: hypothetical protein ABL973_11255 [Micropepsaceae bacterium]
MLGLKSISLVFVGLVALNFGIIAASIAAVALVILFEAIDFGSGDEHKRRAARAEQIEQLVHESSRQISRSS